MHTCYSTKQSAHELDYSFSFSWRNTKVIEFITKWAIEMWSGCKNIQSASLKTFHCIYPQSSQYRRQMKQLHLSTTWAKIYISCKIWRIFWQSSLQTSIPAYCSLETAAKQSGEARIYNMNIIISEQHSTKSRWLKFTIIAPNSTEFLTECV